MTDQQAALRYQLAEAQHALRGLVLEKAWGDATHNLRVEQQKAEIERLKKQLMEGAKA